jgi:hypothetical protein
MAGYRIMAVAFGSSLRYVRELMTLEIGDIS